MKSIYLCHDELDIKLAGTIKKMFELENIEETRDILKADVHLFLFTNNSNKSLQVMEQLQKMVLADKKFLTLKYTDSGPSDELSFYVGTSQWMDMRDKNAVESLLKKILRLIRS